MQRKLARMIAFGIFAQVAILSGAWWAQAQNAATRYPKMAPIGQYLMDRNEEIALARTAAPEAISRDAKVMVLDAPRVPKPRGGV